MIEVVGELISKPYIEITLNLLARFGIAVQRDGWQRFTIPAGSRYRSPGDIHVEADASSASYFIALGAIAGGDSAKTAPHRRRGRATPSRATSASSRRRGRWARRSTAAPTGSRSRAAPGRCKAIDLDCNHIPDAAMTLAVMALYADGPSTLRNIASWRVKETDRIAAMATELRKLGATVEEGAGLHPRHAAGRSATGARPASTPTTTTAWRCASRWRRSTRRGVPVRIHDPHCVAKTFPDYFETLFSVAAAAADASR